MSLSHVVAVAVTPRGPLRFSSVEEAISNPLVSLADPIFLQDCPIDRTLIRGPYLEDFSDEDDPWEFLAEKALDPATIPVHVKLTRTTKASSPKLPKKVDATSVSDILADESLTAEEKTEKLQELLATPSKPRTSSPGEPNPDLLGVRRRGRPPGGLKYYPDWVIRVLVDENPRNGAARQRFKIYQDGMTIQEFIDAGGDRKDLSYDTAPERNYIRVVAPGVEVVDG